MKVLLVIYDNGSFLTYFPMWAGYLVSAVRKAGYDIDVYDQNIYHYPEEHLIEYLKKNHYDLVGIGMIAGYYQYEKLLKLSAAINSVAERPFFVLGGHMPSPDPEFFIKKTNADAVVIGEGEISFVNLLDALSSNKGLSGIKGIAYREGDRVVINKGEELIGDVDSIALPAWDAFSMDYYTMLRNPGIRRNERCFEVLASRGCLYNCSFCYRMDKGFRPRSPESVIEEIGILKTDYHVSYIEFTDELLFQPEEVAIEFCEALIRSGLNIKFYCSGRLNMASPRLLVAMKTAGCVYINYGIESLDDDVLENMGKHLTVKTIIEGIENTIKAGIHPGFNLIFGNIGDNRETLKKSLDFLLKYNTYSELRTIRPVTPYPGSPLFYYAIEKGLLKDTEDFYENKHRNSDLLSVNFTDMSDEEVHRSLFEANKILIEDYFKKKATDNIGDFKRLYLEGDVSYRGPRQT